MAHAKQVITTTSTAAGSSLFDQLSPELLQEVLQRVPQSWRLWCGHVCKAWAAAVARTPIDVRLRFISSGGRADNTLWLEQHGGRVQSLQILGYLPLPDSGLETPPLRLPWEKLTQLQSLDLSFCKLPPIKSAGSSTAPLLLPELKALRLSHCHLDTPNTLSPLASPGLTSLSLRNLKFDDTPAVAYGDMWLADTLANKQRMSTAVSDALQPLRQLVSLQIHDHSLTLTGAGFQHVAGMQHLEMLELALDLDAACSAAHLPSNLTALRLSYNQSLRFGLNNMPTAAPQLHHLSRLQRLCLEACSLSNENVGGMGQLEGLKELQLASCTLIPHDSAASLSLLRALQQLTQLARLCLFYTPLHLSQDALPLCAALTASPQLSHLEVWGTATQPPLPRQALQHALGGGRQLPQLLVLNLGTYTWFGLWTWRGLTARTFLQWSAAAQTCRSSFCVIPV